MVQTVGETLQQIAPPVLPQIAAPGMAIQAATQQAPLVAATVGRAAAAAAPAVQATVQAPARAVRAAGRAVGMLAPEQADMDAVGRTASALQRGSAGAAGVPMASERVARAEMMPVPFTGPSALTAGQASRNFAQLQFEKESAKLGDVGAPLRERVETQTANMIRNFDALIDMQSPVAADPRAMGMGVDRALVNRVEVQRRKVRDAYKKAEAEGEMQDPVEMAQLASQLTTMVPLEGLVKTIPAIRAEGIRLGVLGLDEAGNLVPRTVSLEKSELLRKFVNKYTDWGDSSQAIVSRQINASIDAATEGAGGEAYRAARKQRERFANEFENVGLTAKLLGTKRGTDERQVAFGDVFDKVVLTAPVEEMNKLRSTLLRAGPEGQQAWSDLKSGGIRFIKDSSLSPSQRDSSGNPLLSPDKLQRTVRSLDQDGKLEALYGKRQAQVLRDLADLATDIYTAPPGAINTSNTASALMVAFDSLATFGLTGIPAPTATLVREGAKYVRNRKTRARIEAALRGQVTAAE
jgi:ribosome-associated translation inhibitor RaiA